MRRFGGICLTALLACCLAGLPVHAQHGGGGGPGGPGGPPGGGGHGMGPGGGMPGMGPGGAMGGGIGGGDYGRDNGSGGPNRSPDSAGTSRSQLSPLGRWWDDKHFAKNLKLRSDQQRRMDAIFETNRPALAKGLEDLQTEQSRLDAMYRSKSLDEGTLYAQIDRVSQARAELGKVYTHFQLQIRGEMDAEQLGKLDAAQKQP